MGLYGRKRHNFFSDFTYNKFHFGVYLQVVSAVGLFKVRKLIPPYRLFGAIMFMGAIAFTSIPAYYEGVKEIHNDPVDTVPGIIRRCGFYMLVAGYAWIWVVGRGSIPILGIKL